MPSTSRELQLTATPAALGEKTACICARVARPRPAGVSSSLASGRCVSTTLAVGDSPFTHEASPVLGSLSSAIVFISMRPLLAIGVYALNVLLLGCVFAAYFLVAPGAGSADWTMWFGLVVSQAYIAARVFTKLAFWSGEVAAVQRHCDCREPVREAVIT